MANETNFTYSSLKVWQETTEGEIPSSPSAIKVRGLINDTITETQKTETNPEISSSSQASRKDRGTSDYAGNLECKIQGDILPFLAIHTIGGLSTKTSDFNTGDWTASTAYAEFDPFISLDNALSGDIVKHSNGTNTLVCITAGTSGATEPDLTGVSIGDTVTDGTATWEVRGLKYRYEGEMGCRPSFGCEMQADSSCGTASNFTRRYQGVYANSWEISKSNGDIIHKYSIPVVGSYATDNVSDDNFTSIEDETGYTEQEMTQSPFSFSEMRVRFDGSAPTNARTFNMMINRNTSLTDAVEEDKKVSDTPQPEVSGEIQLKFTKEEYEKSYNNEATTITAMFGKTSGDLCHLECPYVERDRVSPVFSTSESAYLTVPLTASGDDTTATVIYDILSEMDYSSVS